MIRNRNKADRYDIRKTQLIELDILLEFDRVCRKNNLSYFLDSGTALGAVRHGGFIPWDDDIDVGMFREDYDKLVGYAYKDIGRDFFFQTIDTDPGCPCLFAKIRKNGTCYLENNKEGMKMHTGIWIDIFPYDNITDNPKEQLRVARKMNWLLTLFSLKKIPHKETNNGQNPVKYALLSFARRAVHLFLQPLSDSFFIASIKRVIRDNEKCEGCVTCYYFISYNGVDNPIIFKKEKLVPLTEIEFEGDTFWAVNDTNYYLRVLYGDYMKMPPKEMRYGHRPLYVDHGENTNN